MELFTTYLSEQAIQHIGWVLVHFLWQGIVVAALMWCVLKVLAKASANIRYIAACAGLILMTAAPVATFVITAPDAPMASVQTSVEQPVATAPAAAPVKTVVMAPAEPVTLPAPSLWERSMETLEAALPTCVIGWIAGVAALSLWYLGGWCQLQRLRRIGTKSVPAVIAEQTGELAQRLGIAKAACIAESVLVQVPTVIGWLKPVILLPASALTGLDEIQLKAMIAHELAHIKRYDYLVNIAQTVVEILGFYHPCVWWASRQIRIERENCCDDIAINLVQSRKEYAEALFSMEAIRSKQHSLAVAASGGHLQNRISRLAGKSTSHQKSGWIPSVITILLVSALLITGALAMSNKIKTKQIPTEQEIYNLFQETEEALISKDSEAIDRCMYFENNTLRQKFYELLAQQSSDEMCIFTPPPHIIDITAQPNGTYEVFVLFSPNTKRYESHAFIVIPSEARYKLNIYTQEILEEDELAKTTSPQEYTRIYVEKELNKWKNATADELNKMIQSRIQQEEHNLIAYQYAQTHNLPLIPELDLEYITLTLNVFKNTPPEQLRQTFIEDISENLKKYEENNTDKTTDDARMESMNYLRKLGMAWYMYTDEHDGDRPEKLEDLYPYLEDEIFQWLGKNAVLLNIWGDLFDPAKTPVGYDKIFLEKTGYRIVAFADGHAEIDNNDGLKDLLDEALRISNRVERARQLMSFGRELWTWADKHQYTLPDSIEQVEFEDAELKIWAIENVAYRAAGKVISEIEDTTKEVIAYDKNLSKTDNGTNLLFADVHVEFVKKDKLTDFGIDRFSQEDPTQPKHYKTLLGQNGTGYFDRDATIQIGDIMIRVDERMEAKNIGTDVVEIKKDNRKKTLLLGPNGTGYFKRNATIWIGNATIKAGRRIAITNTGSDIITITTMPFKVIKTELEPVAQGKNVLYVTVKNASYTEQLFGVHIYTRSVDYGPQGVGWGTPFFETFQPGETKRVRFVYKIQGPVTDNTYIRLKYYNPASEEAYEYEKPFAEHYYKGNELQKRQAATNLSPASQKQFEEVSAVLKTVQNYIRTKDYQKAWDLFADDYQKGEYQIRGFEIFEKQMEPTHPTQAAFYWEKADFLKLKPLKAFADNGTVKLQAACDDAQWTIDFVKDNNVWKINWIAGYTPAVIKPQQSETDEKSEKELLHSRPDLAADFDMAQPWKSLTGNESQFCKDFFEVWDADLKNSDGSAIDRYREFMEKYPDSPANVYLLNLTSAVHMRFQRYDQAQQALKQAIQLAGDDRFVNTLQINLANAEMEAGGMQQAEARLKRIMALPVPNTLEDSYAAAPQLFIAPKFLAKLYRKKGNAAAADALIQQAHNRAEQMAAENPSIQWLTSYTNDTADDTSAGKSEKSNLEELLKQARKEVVEHNRAKAIELYKQAVDLDPDSVDANLNLAWLLYMYKGGQFANGKTVISPTPINEIAPYFEKVLELDHNNGSAMAGLGNIAEENGNIEKAINLYEKNIEVSGDAADASMHRLANIYRKRGNYLKAGKYYNMFLKIHPDAENVKGKRDYCEKMMGESATSESQTNNSNPSSGSQLSGPKQVLTKGYIVQIPKDWPLLTKFIPTQSTSAVTITSKELKSILESIEHAPNAEVTSSPNLLTNDNQTGQIQIGSQESGEYLELNLTCHVAPDGKTVRAEVAFERTFTKDQGDRTTHDITSMVAAPSGSAFALGGYETGDGQNIEILLIQPTILKDQPSEEENEPLAVIGSGFGGGALLTEQIQPPKNRDKISGVEFPVIDRISSADPNQMETQIYDVSDILHYPGTTKKPAEDIDELKQMIIQSIVPSSWQENGGKGRIDVVAESKLIIRQTPQVHETLETYFVNLRNDLFKYQVAIEARFILAENLDFLKDIEIEDTGPAAGQAIEGPVNSEKIKAALEAKLPDKQILPLNNFPALDDLQTSRLIKGTQSQSSTIMLTAPKATVFNGESARMKINNDVRYTDIDDSEKDIANGLALDILPVVQPGGKEVLLKGHVQMTDILENRPVELHGKMYEIPYLQVTNIPVQAIVESAGTLLIEGPEITVSKSIETNPGLSKIPILGRTFSNRSEIVDKQRLLILIKPTVVEQQEQEAPATLVPAISGSGFGGAMMEGQPNNPD